jgi:hypothetical protein
MVEAKTLENWRPPDDDEDRTCRQPWRLNTSFESQVHASNNQRY